jgi:hypothetical protein
MGWFLWMVGVCVAAGVYGGWEMGAMYAAAFVLFIYAASRG